jgi:hypothetical protein
MGLDQMIQLASCRSILDSAGEPRRGADAAALDKIEAVEAGCAGEPIFSSKSTNLRAWVPWYPDAVLAMARVLSIDAAPGAELVHVAGREWRRRCGPAQAIRASPSA